MERTDKEKNALLRQLSALVHPNGRKKRTDKGQSHNYPSNRSSPQTPRVDKGVQREQQTPLSIYQRVKARMYNKDQEAINNGEQPLLRGFDENGYYIVIPASYQTEAKNYTQVHEGRQIAHTVRRVCTQKEIDLERYRFEAWQWLATRLSTMNQPADCLSELMSYLSHRYGILGNEAKELIAKRQITWFELFCEFYYLNPNDAVMWDYDTWQNMYKYCPCETLPEDFTFSLTLRPGTPEFHPEWAYHAEKISQREQEDIEAEKLKRKLQFINHWRK